MSAFYDGKYDILLSTTIIESGLDIPTAQYADSCNRADMFGLAQAVSAARAGRAAPKLRAYSLFTAWPAQQKITAQSRAPAESCCSRWRPWAPDFQLASHDLGHFAAPAICWGEEQSGHIKEVGFELYQSMLEEAILNLKAGRRGGPLGGSLVAARSPSACRC